MSENHIIRVSKQFLKAHGLWSDCVKRFNVIDLNQFVYLMEGTKLKHDDGHAVEVKS